MRAQTCNKVTGLPLLPRWLPLSVSIGPLGLFLLVLLLLTGVSSPASALNFNAYWAYRQSGGEDRDTLREFQQRYSLGVGPALTYQPTHAIRASAAVGYTRTQSDPGTGMVASDELTPSAQLSLVNDIFLAQLAGTSYIRNTDKTESTLSSWEATLGTSWSIPLVPSLRYSYSEFVDTPDNLTLFTRTGQKEKNSNISVTWDLILADFSYQFSNYKSEDPVSNSLYESDSHFARFETEGRFWENRLNYNFAQQFGYTTQDITIEDQEGFFDFPLEGERYAKVTDPDTPLDQLLPDSPDYEDPASPLPQDVDVDEHVHFYFAGDFPAQIDIVRLTVADSFTRSQALELRWAFYTRSDPSDPWVERRGNLQGAATLDDNRSIDIAIGRPATDFILVAENVPSGPLVFTSFLAFTKITQTSSSTTTSNLSNFSIGYLITRTLRASANLTKEQTESEYSDDIANENDRRTVSGSLKWSPLPYIRPSIDFSEFREKSSETPEDIDRSYSLTVTTIPIESMVVTYGYTRQERFIDEQKTLNSNRYRLNTKAEIYPDLTGSWSISYTDLQRLEDDGFVTGETSINNRIVLNAQLLKYLSGDFTTSYTHREFDLDTTDNADAIFSLRYRPSDILSLRGSYTTYFLDRDTTDKFDLNMNLMLISTLKTRLTFTATHRQSDETTDNFGLVGSWDIGRNLSLLTQGNYLMAEKNTYNFRINLSLGL